MAAAIDAPVRPCGTRGGDGGGGAVRDPEHPQEGPQRAWVDVRQQLLGRQREREAQERLLAAATDLQTRLTRAAAGGPGAAPGGPGAPAAPAARAAVLWALAETVNDLLRWRRDELAAAPGAGALAPRAGAAGDLAAELLARVQRQYPLFAAAGTADGVLDCGPVAGAVGRLQGAPGDACYREALEGLAFLLKACADRLAAEAPTAPLARPLASVWHELLSEVDALAGPGPEPAAAGGPRVLGGPPSLRLLRVPRLPRPEALTAALALACGGSAAWICFVLPTG
jgi:hypothetical protein